MNRQKRLREEKKLRGECLDCKNKALSGRVNCAPCQIKRRIAFKKYRKKCKAKGKCFSCDKRARPERVRCTRCQAKSDNAVARYRIARVAVGKCGTCGKPRGEKSTYFCDKHADNHRRWGIAYSHKKFPARLTREQITKRTMTAVIGRVKAEMGKAWNAEVAEFVKANWETFYDRLDPLLYKASEYNDQRDGDST